MIVEVEGNVCFLGVALAFGYMGIKKKAQANAQAWTFD